jgi:predicted HNH restriction endonuclease
MNSWIFQARPDKFDILGYISRFKRIYWSAGQLSVKQRFEIGDEVFIYKAFGKPKELFAGVVATGRVVELPVTKRSVQHPENLGEEFWRNGGSEISELKVGVQLDETRTRVEDGVLQRDVLLADKDLGESQFVKVRSGTVFLLSGNQPARLRALWESLKASNKISTDVVSKQARNPPWIREELLLALELYLQNPKSPPSKTSPQVLALAEELNDLRSCLQATKLFLPRTASAVYLKMMNFRSHDPAFTSAGRVGMSNGNKLEPEVWEEFYGRMDALGAQCRSIRAAIRELPNTLESSEEIDGFAEAQEGRLLTKLHLRRERSVQLISKKKEFALKKSGKLECEACGFDFARVYGARGHGFIECHHTKPVHSFGDGHRTTTDDLALLCANCHRMIHTTKPWLQLDELKTLLKKS